MPDLGLLGNIGEGLAEKTGAPVTLGSANNYFNPTQPTAAPVNSAQQQADFNTEQQGYATKLGGVQSLADTAKARYGALQTQNKEGLAAYGANTQQGLYEGRRAGANALAAQQGSTGVQGGRGGYAALLGTGLATGQQAQDYVAKRGEGYQQLSQDMQANEYNQNIAAQKAQDQATDVKQNLGTETARRETKWQPIKSSVMGWKDQYTHIYGDNYQGFADAVNAEAAKQTDPVLKQRLTDLANQAVKDKSLTGIAA